MTDTKLVPLRDIVLLEMKGLEEKTTATGIIIQTDQKNKDYHGVYCNVLAVGPDVASIKPGDEVVVNRYDTLPTPYEDMEMAHGDMELHMLREQAVFAVVGK